MARASRRPELSAINVLLCLGIVLFHCASHPITYLDKLSWQFALAVACQRLTCLGVTGFFFLSGIKLTLPAPRKSLPQYYLGRAKRLVAPYVLAAAVYYLVFVRLGWYAFSLGDLVRHTLRGSLSAQFYFVVALIQFTLLAPVFRALAKNGSPALLLPFALALTQCSGPFFASLAQHFPNTPLPYYTGSVFTNFLFYYLAGCFAGANYEAFRSLLKKNRSLIIPMALLSVCADQLGSVLHYSGRCSIPYLDSLHLLYYISAMLLLCSLPAVEWTGVPGRLLEEVDRASYLIYLYHCLVIALFNLWAPGWGLTGIGAQFLVRVAVTCIVTVGGSVLWQRLWRRSAKSK